MGPAVEKKIVDAATLASSVDALNTGLKIFGENARQMENISSSFQSRLSQIEYEMRPMKMMSQKLTVARKNVSEAVIEMEKVNEYFSLESLKKDSIARGLRGANSSRLTEYASDVRRLLKAISFLKDLPTLRSQQAAISGLSDLCNTASAELIDEYGRIVRGLGPSVQYSKEAKVYEPIAPLNDSIKSSLVTIHTTLDLLNKKAALRKTYSSTRRITVATTLRSWSDRYEMPSIAGRSSSTDPRVSTVKGVEKLSNFLDFAVKLVAGERLLWEEAIGVNPAKKRDSAAEESFFVVVTGVIQKLLKDIDSSVKETVNELKISQSESSKNKDKLEKGKGSSLVEGDRLIEGTVLLLEMADTLNRGAVLLLRVLRMGEKKEENTLTAKVAGVQSRLCQAALSSCIDLVEAIRNDPTGKKYIPMNAAVHVLTSNTMHAVKRIMPFREGYEILANTSKESLPWEFKQKSSSKLKTVDENIKKDTTNAENCIEAQKCLRFTKFLNHIIRQLISNLNDKSQSYPNGRSGDAIRQLFLLNNANYLITNSRATNANFSVVGITQQSNSIISSVSVRADAIETIFKPMSPNNLFQNEVNVQPGSAKRKSRSFAMTPRTERRNSAVDTFFSGNNDQRTDREESSLSLAHFLSESTNEYLEKFFLEKAQAYCAIVFDPIATVLVNDVGQLEYGSRGKLLSLECGRLIKSKFSTFNETWEEFIEGHQNICAGDDSIRQLLTDEARRRIYKPYKKLFETFKDVQFSKKHQQEYLKFTPEDVKKAIDELFKG